MSQFDEIVKNIALENEKCNYNPETDMNWGKLTVRWGVQEDCRKHMDFKTRIHLGQTSKREKDVLSYILNFQNVVKNIALENEKSNYNPEIDMNWDCLPMEMRNECVKHLDFKTRFRLRRVSKAEKSLVDTKKFRFKRFKLMFDHDHSRWDTVGTAENGSCEFWREDKRPNFEFISGILKNAEVEHFRFSAQDFFGSAVPPVLKQLEKLAPFRFKRVSMDGNMLFIHLLKHCPNLEKVDFMNGLEFPQALLDMILDIPTVMNIKEFRFTQSFAPDFSKFLKELVQKWIDNDGEIGKSVQFDSQTEGIVNTFYQKFADRIIEKTDEKVRIRMDNRTKQIVFRHIGSRVQMLHYMRPPEEINIEYCSCKVVPIDMPKSEYGIGDGWIQAVYEQGLEMDGKLENPVEFDIEDQVWR